MTAVSQRFDKQTRLGSFSVGGMDTCLSVVHTIVRCEMFVLEKHQD